MRLRNQTRGQKRKIRQSRTAKKIKSATRPRLAVFRSSKHIYAQLIDDEKAVTVVSAGDREISAPVKNEKNVSRKVNIAYLVGKLIASKAIEKKVTEVIFDRGGYKYHGRVKSLADGAREGGLKF